MDATEKVVWKAYGKSELMLDLDCAGPVYAALIRTHETYVRVRTFTIPPIEKNFDNLEEAKAWAIAICSMDQSWKETR